MKKKLVIEIDKKDYNNINPFLSGEPIKGGFNLFKALEIIKNGIPLSKGQGTRITNAEKFKDIFGHEPDMSSCPFECSTYKNCPYFEAGRSCRMNEFWDSEWKENK